MDTWKALTQSTRTAQEKHLSDHCWWNTPHYMLKSVELLEFV